MKGVEGKELQRRWIARQTELVALQVWRLTGLTTPFVSVSVSLCVFSCLGGGCGCGWAQQMQLAVYRLQSWLFCLVILLYGGGEGQVLNAEWWGMECQYILSL